MTVLRVFIPYFGAKYMRAPRYPAPLHDTIIEPFAGAAGYSVRNHERNVILIDRSEYIAGVWSYLIHVGAAEVASLPLLRPGDTVDDLKIPQEAKWLIGFWINQGSSTPKKTMGGRWTNRKTGTWGDVARARLSSQVEHIRHWKVIHGDYRDAPNVDATWFIDPPYQEQGKNYPYQIDDYDVLARWCRSRIGQVMVCESEGADWLEFRPITTVVGGTHRKTTEVLWQSESEKELLLF